MKQISKEELKEVITKHELWLNNKEGGERADLRYADLRSADLRYANLSDANLRSADLRSADLRSADLSDANLRAADLRYANLSDANLRSANLRYAVSPDFTITGLRYHVCAFYRKDLNDVVFFIGCKTMSLSTMKGRTLEIEWDCDDGDAVKFMAEWKTILIKEGERVLRDNQS